jgi:long-chain fatty acid transport protein
MPNNRCAFAPTATLLCAGLIAGDAAAGGFALNEQNARHLGSAFAGRASDAADASTLFTNPAGMARLERAEISAGVALLQGDTDISHAQGTFPGSNDGDPVPTVTIPFAYYVQPIDDRWAAGIGLYTAFGVETDYETGFQGRYFGTTSDVKVITLQPSVSYRLNEQWSIGAGLTYNWIEGELSRNQPNPLSPGSDDIRSRVEGDDSASWGYNIGVLFEPNDNTRVGLSYRSEVDYELKGHTTISNVPLTGTLRYDAALDLTLPATVDLSVTQRLDDRWTLHVSAVRTGWSSFDELVVENTGGPTAVETHDWDDTWTYAAALSYALNAQWILRGGFGFDESPIPDAHRSVRVPTGDRRIFALGATWTPAPQWRADFAYAWFHEEEVTVAQSAPSLSYSADYQTDIHALAVQLNYTF